LLANLLPGLREVRAPLVSGYLWLAFFLLAFDGDLPTRGDPGGLEPLFALAEGLSVLGIATVTGIAAYLVGSAVQELLKLLARLLSQRPLYGEAGIRTSAAGRNDVRDAVRIRVQGIKRELFQVALSPGEKGIDEEPTAEMVERELPLIRSLLLGERPEFVGELDRLKAEADLRVTVAFPLLAFAIYLTLEGWPAWLGLVVPAGLLLIQGVQRQLEAGDMLAKALRIGQADAPVLEALASSADAVLQRVELEGELRRSMEGEDGMAAFRLGNLQVSWDDFGASVSSFEFATEKGIVRAYAELGRAHEGRSDLEEAERAYRDGAERGDAKAQRRLAVLLSRLERDEEARKAAERAEGGEDGRAESAPAGALSKVSSRAAAAYRQRIEEGDAKAALNLGMLLERQGNWDDAIAAFEQATALDEGDAQAWFQLGLANATRMRTQPAQVAYERALEIRERELGPDHLEVAITLGNLGGTIFYLGDYERARELLERALEIKESELGRNHLGLAVTLGNLSLVLNSLGDYEKARELQERALAIRKADPTVERVKVAISLEFLATSTRALGDYEKSRELLEQALAIKEAVLGPKHLDVAAALDELGATLRNLGDDMKARELHERALEIAEGELGPNHRMVGEILTGLGATRRALGDLTGSEAALRRAIEILEAIPVGLPRPLALHALGETLRATGRPAEALAAFERAIELLEGMFEDGHPKLADALEAKAAALDDLGRPEGADEARARAASVRRARRRE
jgi:tetratricopeptide (TPR) repeat protein